MKKLFFVVLLVLLAAGCNSFKQSSGSQATNPSSAPSPASSNGKTQTTQNANKRASTTASGEGDDSQQYVGGLTDNQKLQAREEGRVAFAKKIGEALYLYSLDYGTYPQLLSSLAPKYIGVLPTAPTPADGNCTAEQNNFRYTYISPSEFKLTFCLGHETEGYSAGVRTLTEDNGLSIIK